jgi:hypothetical protein
MRKYALVFHMGWVVYRCEPDGKRYQLTVANTFDDAVRAAAYDNGGPVVVKADVLETQ